MRSHVAIKVVCQERSNAPDGKKRNVVSRQINQIADLAADVPPE